MQPDQRPTTKKPSPKAATPAHLHCKPMRADRKKGPLVVSALLKMGGKATVSELAEHIYGISTPQTRNRVSVHLTEQLRRGKVVRPSRKFGAWLVQQPCADWLSERPDAPPFDAAAAVGELLEERKQSTDPIRAALTETLRFSDPAKPLFRYRDRAITGPEMVALLDARDPIAEDFVADVVFAGIQSVKAVFSPVSPSQSLSLILTPAHLRAMAAAGWRAGEENPATWLVSRAERAQDFEADFLRITAGKCAGDEVHCSCVPHLRRQIAQLKAPASTPEPPPTPGTGDVWQSVISGLPPGRLRDACVERRAFGLKKYGTALQAGNGRNWRTDALQEALDGIAYAAQGVAEGDPEAAGALERAIAHAETVVRLVGGAV